MAFLVGTAGHVDHGKSSLIEALTGTHPDRLPEEKARSMSIELGFDHFALPSGQTVGVVDVPGHERFVRTMAAGTHALDFVLFVIAANEGIKPQTREHLAICQLLQVPQGIIVLTKSDLVNETQKTSLIQSVDDFIKGTFLETAPKIFFSKLNRNGLTEIVAAIDHAMVSNPLAAPLATPLSGDFTREMANDNAPFRLWVDRSFNVKGFGNVITGTSLSGSIRAETTLMAYPQKKKYRVRQVQAHGTIVTAAKRGMRTALNVSPIAKDSAAAILPRGSLLGEPDRILCGSKILTLVSFLPSFITKKSFSPEKSIPALFIIGTTHFLARLRLLSPCDQKPHSFWTRVDLERPAPLVRGERFILRNTTPETIAGGIILDPQPNFRNPNQTRTETLTNLTAEFLPSATMPDPKPSLIGFLKAREPVGLTLNDLTPLLTPPFQDFALIEQSLEANSFVSINSQKKFWVLSANLRFIENEMTLRVDDYQKNNPLQPGIPIQELLGQLERHLKHFSDFESFKTFLHAILKQLSDKKKLNTQNNSVTLFTKTVHLSPEQNHQLQNIIQCLSTAQQSPPSVKTLGQQLHLDEKTIRQLLHHLCDQKALVRVSSDFYFESNWLYQTQEQLIQFLKDHKNIDMGNFKRLTDTTRKHAIPLIEYFDHQKLTLRVGDQRVLRQEIKIHGG